MLSSRQRLFRAIKRLEFFCARVLKLFLTLPKSSAVEAVWLDDGWRRWAAHLVTTVGFDRRFEMLENSARTDWPPYNMEKTGENDYRIAMAIGGFSRNVVRSLADAA
ncbi:hypothetical protein ACVOMV_07115 [Mesorhizobium atlanticum]